MAGMEFDARSRRRFVSALAAAALARPGSGAPVDKYPRNLTKDDITSWMKELSNWGRWGKDDQAGTVNLITPAKRKQAAALVKEGISVSLSLDADILPKGAEPEPAPPPPTAGCAGTIFTLHVAARDAFERQEHARAKRLCSRYDLR